MSATPHAPRYVLTREGFGGLLRLLRQEGYQLVGPTVRDHAIVHAEIQGIDDLPAGWTETQHAGSYRLTHRDDQALFGYAVGPHSWKPYFFVPRLRLFKARRTSEGLAFEPEEIPSPRLALIGARACDLHAIELQDRTFLHGAFVDADYAARRQDVFVVAVNCGRPGGTCFCASMATGPRATVGFDLALTELVDPPHRFVVEVGTWRGREMLLRVPVDPARPEDRQRAEDIVTAAEQSMGRTVETGGLKELLYRNPEHPQWDAVALHCMACTNCTLVCPTCFCSSVEDVSDLAGDTAERWRRWDSCCTLEHSFIHGSSVRSSIRSRYRQWLTHKFASWVDQFGASGCTGCGRCITWCPVGIDVREQVAAIRATDGATAKG